MEYLTDLGSTRLQQNKAENKVSFLTDKSPGNRGKHEKETQSKAALTMYVMWENYLVSFQDSVILFY